MERNFKTSKFKTLAKLAIKRVAIVKNQHQVRGFHARSDVSQLLDLGHHEQALLRVEHVIKEQNMLDAFVMIENYCHILIKSVKLLQKKEECPDELKEAISGLIFASSRCGEFPELHRIRDIFVSKFGKDFASHAVELRNNCGVNPTITQKLSARQSSLESRLQMLKGIASQKGVTLNLEEYSPEVTENLNVNQKLKQPECNNFPASLDHSMLRDGTCDLPKKLNLDEWSEWMKTKKYRDVAAAAQEASDTAAYAAARAAVKLSGTESQDDEPDDHGDSNPRQGFMNDSDDSHTPKIQRDECAASEEIKHSNVSSKYHDLSSDRKSHFPTHEHQHNRQFDIAYTENLSDADGNKLPYHSLKEIPHKTQVDPVINSMERKFRGTSKHSIDTAEQSHSQHSNIKRKGVSMRTRR
ncbi:Ist1 domain-containing protein, partial [Cephalotus follicularis]